MSISINSQRFRNPKEFAPEPAPGVTRIAVLGDSFTLGWGVNDDQTYPAQMQQSLWNSNSSKAVEVINAGVHGTGTGQQALLYDLWVKRFHPNVVILTVNFNDVDDDLLSSPFSADETGGLKLARPEETSGARRWVAIVRKTVRELPAYTFLVQHSQLLKWARIEASWLFVYTPGPTYPNAEASPERQETATRLWSRGVALMMREVIWLNQRTQAAGVKLLVVFFPGREAIYPSAGRESDEVRWKSERISKALNETCSPEGIPFLDLTPEFRKHVAQQRPPLYYEGADTHPDPMGYHVTAEAVAKFLVEKQLI